MLCFILYWQGKMGREVMKVSFIFVLLIQFQPGLYNFLDASKPSQDQDVVLYSPEQEFQNSSIESRTLLVQVSHHQDKNNNKNSISIDDKASWTSDESGKSDSGGYDTKSIYENTQSDNVHESEENDDEETIVKTKKLLRFIGMSKRPKKESLVTNYTTEVFINQGESDFPTSDLNIPKRFKGSTNTVRSFYHAGNEKELPGFHTNLRFDITSIPDNEILTGAELRIPFNWDTHNKKFENVRIYFIIHDVVKLKKKSSKVKQNSQLEPPQLTNPITHPIDTKSLKLSSIKKSKNTSESTFWLIFDVFPAVKRLTSATQKKNVRLALEIVFKNGTQLFEVFPSMKNSQINGTISKNTSTPMLLTYSDDSKNPRKPQGTKTLSRHYRAAKAKHHKKQKKHRHKNRRKALCSRREMYVDFGLYGWDDWITAPPGYQAFYCSGECPFPMAEHLNATNHAVIQALAHSMNPARVPSPCCVPNKYSSLMILYSDSSGSATLKVYEKMIVESCGCS